MIANVSPAVATFEDTYNTLKYANRAKNIKTHVQRNVLSVQYHISNYTNIINNLKAEIVDLKSQLNTKGNNNHSILKTDVTILGSNKKEDGKDNKDINISQLKTESI
jgi:kinesin family protein 18/19